MGGCLSRRGREENEDKQSLPKYSWDREDRPDRSLMIVTELEGNVVGRLPGQLNGTQFKISKCRDTVVLVLDHTDSVIVDKCEACKIVIGPCRGSVFIRNCINCVVVVACQQYRARDCQSCHTFLFCKGQPVIESCTSMKFSCYQCSYPQLKGQFDSAKLNVLNNQWSAVHDFTRGLEESNWSLVFDAEPEIEGAEQGEFEAVGVSFSREDSIVPFTTGCGQITAGETCVVAFFSQDDLDVKALEFVNSVKGKVQLILTRQASLSAQQAESLFSRRKELTTSASKGLCVLLAACGEDCCKVCHSTMKVVGVPGELAYASPNPDQGRTDYEALATYNAISLTTR